MARLRRGASEDELLALLPSGLRTFSLGRWIGPNEDVRDPVDVHCFAWRRWKIAQAEALGLRELADLPDDTWWGPVAGRTECPCRLCTVDSE
jgi:hypothetical protein